MSTSLPTPPDPARRLGTLKHYATYRGVSYRTTRVWAQRGYFPLYRLPGMKAVVVDVDEADAALAALPPGTIRPGYATFKGNAPAPIRPAATTLIRAEVAQ
jgi:hypothetical protein